MFETFFLQYQFVTGQFVLLDAGEFFLFYRLYFVYIIDLSWLTYLKC